MMSDSPTWEQYRIHLVAEMDRMATALDHLTDRIEHLEKAVVRQTAVANQNSRNISILVSGIISIGVVISRLIWEYFFHR